MSELDIVIDGLQNRDKSMVGQNGMLISGGQNKGYQLQERYIKMLKL